YKSCTSEDFLLQVSAHFRSAWGVQIPQLGSSFPRSCGKNKGRLHSTGWKCHLSVSWTGPQGICSGSTSVPAILEVNGNLSCRCAKTTSEYISPKKYESIEIRPVGSSCRRTEIIIKLRTSGKVCVNPEAPWVKKLLKRIASTKK
uniref:Chemokine interleukin-8-like domain-containing protein n=1 Tax=Junco hyemalis TaxID=40217 RepID=A0A8C5IWZ4_JUNHY